MRVQVQAITMTLDDLQDALEPLIRRVVREELTNLMAKQPDLFCLEPRTPLYEEMEGILQLKAKGKIGLYSHKEVWSESL